MEIDITALERVNRIFTQIKSEPNFFDGDYKGYRYRIVRNKNMGNLCGYVGIPKGHKYYHKHCDKIDMDCHGGLTFSGWHPLPDPEHLWWIGFDCAHSFDFIPFMFEREMRLYGANISPNLFRALVSDNSYRDFNYVMGECENIIDQLRMRDD